MSAPVDRAEKYMGNDLIAACLYLSFERLRLLSSLRSANVESATSIEQSSPAQNARPNLTDARGLGLGKAASSVRCIGSACIKLSRRRKRARCLRSGSQASAPSSKKRRPSSSEDAHLTASSHCWQQQYQYESQRGSVFYDWTIFQIPF